MASGSMIPFLSKRDSHLRTQQKSATSLLVAPSSAAMRLQLCPQMIRFWSCPSSVNNWKQMYSS
jgi:hypothetical protein